MPRVRSGLGFSADTFSRTRRGTASLTLPASGGLASSSHRTTFLPTGRTAPLNNQVHLDLHVDDPRTAHEKAIALGARLLQPASDLDSDEGHQVYADPAGHPFCIGWGQPSPEALAAFVADQLGRKDVD